MKQISNHLIMIQPNHFGFNEETAINNYYQKNEKRMSEAQIKKVARVEFNELIRKMKEKKINVKIFSDRKHVITTDSVFPNNWMTLHEEGKVILYPMFSDNRRKERRNDIIKDYLKENFQINEIIDLSEWEKREKFLEGTGSMVLDRQNKICFAAVSKRTSKSILKEFCKKLNYKLFTFTANQTCKDNRVPIYHTNVMMSIGEKFALICIKSIDDPKEKSEIIRLLNQPKREIIEVNESQIENFVGNILEVQNLEKQNFIIMSTRAFEYLNKKQRNKLECYGEIIHSDLNIIEKIGGGSARCMITENFLMKKENVNLKN